MNLLAILENGLFALGQVMRFPVMALLWVCVIAVCYMAGSCMMESLARRRARRAFDLKAWLRDNAVFDAQARLDGLPPVLRNLVLALRAQQGRGELQAGGIENLVLEAEDAQRHSLNPSRLMVKVAPSLGLLGTLIPMGISLAAMAAGNLEAMAGQMVVAFTSTIIGLACGTAAYVVNLLRQGWVNETLREQRFLAERALAELPEETLSPAAGKAHAALEEALP